VGFCQPSSYLCRRCLAAASAVRASEALFSIMPIICGPILISSVSLPVAVLASAMCGIFCLRGPVLWLVSSYVATLFLLRAPARTAATGPLAPLVGSVARAARAGAVLVCFVNGCLQVCEISGQLHCSLQVCLSLFKKRQCDCDRNRRYVINHWAPLTPAVYTKTFPDLQWHLYRRAPLSRVSKLSPHHAL